MRLISKEDLWKGGFAGKSIDSVVKLVSRFFQCIKYVYVVYILLSLYLVWFVCLFLWVIEQGRIFHKSLILDAWQGSEYASAEYEITCLLMLAKC